MSTELFYLTLVALFTVVCWIPYIVNRAMVLGFTDAMGYPTDPKPMAPWAERAKKAHYNAVENLVVFAPIVLVALQTGKGGGSVASAVMVYFWARVLHYFIMMAGIPYLRTLSYTVGWLCCLVIIWRILM
jgi:uncharacterized MAPEG superfamily protein